MGLEHPSDMLDLVTCPAQPTFVMGMLLDDYFLDTEV